MSEKYGKAEAVIKSLVQLVGVTAGIIILSIGAIIFLESIFKLYIFDLKEDRYNNFDYRCEKYNVDSIRANKLLGFQDEFMLTKPIVKNDKKIEKLTQEDIEFLEKKYKECKKEAQKEAEKEFQKREKMDIAERIAFILVGFPLLYFYQRRERN